jgi:hypothetical protein
MIASIHLLQSALNFFLYRILKTEMQKNGLSILGVSEVWWKGQGEIRSGDYTVYYSGDERAERSVAIVHKIVLSGVVNKIVTTESLLLI